MTIFVVDKNNPLHHEFPESTHGMVFLEKTFDDDGNETGKVFSDLEEVKRRRNLPKDSKERAEWSRYQSILDDPVDPVAPAKHIPKK